MLLESLLAALDVREFLAPEKKALEAAIDLEMDMLSIQSDSFVYDGFEAKCNFDKVHFILSGDSDNLLVRASRRGRIKSVQYLLDLGADANECNGYGDSPLMAAAINGQVGVVRVLMEAHAYPYAEHQEIKRASPRSWLRWTAAVHCTMTRPAALSSRLSLQWSAACWTSITSVSSHLGCMTPASQPLTR